MSIGTKTNKNTTNFNAKNSMQQNNREDHLRKQKIKKDSVKQSEWFFQEMDDLEQQQLCEPEEECQDVGKKKNHKLGYKKPDKNQRFNLIQTYEKALRIHRSLIENSTYHNPFTEKDLKLSIDTDRILSLMEQAKEDEKDVGVALRTIGLKRVKVLYKYGAVEHFDSVIDYLERRELPEWIKIKHQELMNRNFEKGFYDPRQKRNQA